MAKQFLRTPRKASSAGNAYANVDAMTNTGSEKVNEAIRQTAQSTQMLASQRIEAKVTHEKNMGLAQWQRKKTEFFKSLRQNPDFRNEGYEKAWESFKGNAIADVTNGLESNKSHDFINDYITKDSESVLKTVTDIAWYKTQSAMQAEIVGEVDAAERAGNVKLATKLIDDGVEKQYLNPEFAQKRKDQIEGNADFYEVYELIEGQTTADGFDQLIKRVGNMTGENREWQNLSQAQRKTLKTSAESSKKQTLNQIDKQTRLDQENRSLEVMTMVNDGEVTMLQVQQMGLTGEISTSDAKGYMRQLMKGDIATDWGIYNQLEDAIEAVDNRTQDYYETFDEIQKARGDTLSGSDADKLIGRIRGVKDESYIERQRRNGYARIKQDFTTGVYGDPKSKRKGTEAIATKQKEEDLLDAWFDGKENVTASDLDEYFTGRSEANKKGFWSSIASYYMSTGNSPLISDPSAVQQTTKSTEKARKYTPLSKPKLNETRLTPDGKIARYLGNGKWEVYTQQEYDQLTKENPDVDNNDN